MARATFEEQLRQSGIVLRSPEALRRIVTAPGELGFARAYVAGDLDIEGDVYEALELLERRRALSRLLPELLPIALDLGIDALRPPAPPPEEARLRGRRHSKARDAAAIAHHYDVSNRFYRLVLGPSLTYSCAVFADPAATLEEAQEAKHELVAGKLGLGEGMRLLDVGCGWGSMLVHAAERHGVSGIGITNSRRQAELARERVRAAGLADRVEIRLADYRDVSDGPYDAVSSIGMIEHVGHAQIEPYLARLHALLRPQGRLLIQGIGRPPRRRRLLPRRTFVNRYVFPDGDLQEVGSVASRMQAAGLELRHLESLREHYALTLRHWVRNLETSWDEAVAEVGIARARIWRLYMAGSALAFEAGRLQVHQLLAVRPDRGASGMRVRRGVWP